MILLAVAAQLLDLFTFGPAAARYGAAGELNPLVASLYTAGGFPLVAALKIGALNLVLLGVSALSALGAPGWVATAVLVVAIATGLLGALTNVAAVLL